MGYLAYIKPSHHLGTLREIADCTPDVGEAGGRGVESPAKEEDEHTIRRLKAMNAPQIKLNEVLPLIESNLTIEEVAEMLGVPVEAACALVVASLRSSRALAKQP